MRKKHSEKKERPHPMLHGQHEGKMPKVGKKEPMAHGPDHHHKMIAHHASELRKIAKKHHKAK